MGRPRELKSHGSNTPQVSSVVQVPGKAKAESNKCPKIQALRARLEEKYGSTFFSEPFRPILAHREGIGYRVTFDFFPFVGSPREHRGYTGYVANSDFSPLVGDP